MSRNEPENYEHLILALEVEREALNRRLERPPRHGRNAQRALIERKLVVERELARLKAQNSQAGGSKKGLRPEWYESSPNVLKRRQIVLKNRGLSAKSLCKLFDSERIGLPERWEEKFNVTTWSAAYKAKKARANIQRIISTDRGRK